MTGVGAVAVELFGPVRVTVAGNEVPLAGAMPRLIVARLASQPGEPVPIDELIDDLWADPPASANGSLRAYLSRLRGGPLGPMLSSGRGGYRLEIEPDAVDAVRFERLEAAGDLDGARQLWTGAVLTGLTDAPIGARLHRALNDRYRSIAERLAARALEAADPRTALQLIEPIVAAAPGDEQPTELAATALMRLGRTADALAMIDAAQRYRADELGLDPAASLATLRSAVVRRDTGVLGDPADEETVRHGVPRPLTVFVGRDRELEAVAVARTAARLVTLVGPAGVGKTRLAIESARRVGARIDTEQWFLELAPLTGEDELIAALAALVGATAPDLGAIARVLDRTHGLLVLDNAEHLVDEVTGIVSRLLAATDGIAVLVTSRQALGIPGERRIDVEPLLGDVSTAVRIFSDRAADVLPGFTADGDDRELIERLVLALDGLPLALELAAARLDTRGLRELHDGIVDRQLLAAPDGDPQHGLLATIRWSTALLTPRQRELLRQLAEFAGVFTPDAAQAICRLDGAGTAIDSELDALARASLVVVRRADGGEVRHHLLESVKAAVRIDEPLVDEGWSDRHLAWHRDRVTRHESRLHDAAEPVTSSFYDAIRPDLTMAVERALVIRDRGSALAMTAGLGWYWFRRGVLAEGRAWIERALALADAPAGASDARDESMSSSHLAMLLFQLAEQERCRDAAQRAVSAAERAFDDDALGLALSYLSYWEAMYGDVETAIALSDRVAELTVAGWTRSVSLVIRGQALRSAGRPAQALEVLEQAVRVAADSGDAWSSVVAVAVRSKVLMDLKRGREALALLLPITRMSTAQQDPTTTLTNLYLVAGATALIEQHAAGARLIGAAEALGRRIGWDATASEPVDFVVYRERVRQGLPAALWNALLDDGGRLTLSEAVAFAVRLEAHAGRS